MAKQPNILILMPDQFRADCLSCAGHPTVQTPNIDRIAAEGVRFSEAATVSPICMPARASFIGGRYPHQHGMWGNYGRLPAEAPTFFQALQDAGYHTAHVGKSHYYSHSARAVPEFRMPAVTHMRAHEPYMHARGFTTVHETTGPHATRTMRSYMTDRWEEKGLYQPFLDDYAARVRARSGPPGQHKHATHASTLPDDEHMDAYVGRTAAEFVADYNEPAPFCLFVGFPGPHEPWDAAPGYAELYAPESCPEPIPVPEGLGELPESICRRADFQPTPGLTPETVARIRASYYGKIALIDHWIGEILQACECRGWLDELCIVFWSDHGEMAGDHGRLYKQSFHESSVRVPLIVRCPGRTPAGRDCHALAETVDIAPTVMDAAGLDPWSPFEGKSLMPVAAGQESDLRSAQLSEISYGGTRNTMLRTPQHKLVVDHHGRAFMLYDLAEDPNEQQNLAGQPEANGLETELREQLLLRLLAGGSE